MAVLDSDIAQWLSTWLVRPIDDGGEEGSSTRDLKYCDTGISEVDKPSENQTTPLPFEIYLAMAQHFTTVDELILNDRFPKHFTRSDAERRAILSKLDLTDLKWYDLQVHQWDGSYLCFTCLQTLNSCHFTDKMLFERCRPGALHATTRFCIPCGLNPKNLRHYGESQIITVRDARYCWCMKCYQVKRWSPSDPDQEWPVGHYERKDHVKDYVCERCRQLPVMGIWLYGYDRRVMRDTTGIMGTELQWLVRTPEEDRSHRSLGYKEETRVRRKVADELRTVDKNAETIKKEYEAKLLCDSQHGGYCVARKYFQGYGSFSQCELQHTRNL